MLYLVISFFTLIISAFYFSKAAGTLNIFKINMISFVFYYPLLLQSFIGVNIAILYLDNHYILSSLKDYDIRLFTYFMVLLTMILMPFIMNLIIKILNINMRKLYINYLKKQTRPIYSQKDTFIFYPFLLVSFVSIISVIYVFIVTKSQGFLLYFSNLSEIEMAKFRIEISRNFSGNIYIKNIFALGLTPLLSYIAYVYKKTIKNLSFNILHYVLFIFSIYILTYNLEKAPVLWYLIGFLILDIYIYGKIKIGKVCIVAILVIATIVFMYFSSGGIDNYWSLFNYNIGPVGRIVLGQVTPLFYHFYIFPGKHDFLGNNFHNFFGITGDYKRSSRIVMEYVNPSGVKEGTAGVMNTLFIGEAYANFGMLGLILSIIYVSVLFQLIFIYFMKSKKNPITVGLFGYLTINLSNIVTGGFLDFLYNPILIFFFIIIIIIIILGQMLKEMIK